MDNFITQALELPNDTIAYTVSQRLADLFPNRAILEGSDSTFDLLEFSEAGKCEIVGDPGVYNQTSTEWCSARQELDREIVNAWLQVLWNGHLMDVVYLTWTDSGYRTRFFWVAAESRAIAERFIGEVCDWCALVHGEVLVYQDGDWEKDRKLHQAIKSATFDTLVLPEAQLLEIRGDVSRFFGSRETYERYGIVWKRGVLLSGAPGNGKTHTVKALINESNVACLYVRSFRSCPSCTESNMHEVFERARRAAPCIVVLEDLDALVDKQSRSFFLNELDGFAPNHGVLVLATSNYPEKIDPALIDRPGRFDRRYEIGPPAAAERRVAIERWNGLLLPEGRASADGVEKAVTATEGFSFAYLKELLVSSTTEWAHEEIDGRRPRRMDSILETRVGILREQVGRKKKAKQSSQQSVPREENEADDGG